MPFPRTFKIMKPEEIETLSQPSIMDSIPSNEDSDNQIQLAKQLKFAQQLGPTLIGPGLNFLGQTSKLANFKNPLQGNQQAQDIANTYKQQNNFPMVSSPMFQADPERGKLLADAFANMAHTPNDLATKQAYDALIKETLAQFQPMKQAGINFQKILPNEVNPYPNGSKDVFNDISQNNRLKYFPTEQGHGAGGGQKYPGNPLLNPSGEIINGENVPNNDIFRLVYDYYGHAKSGNGFGPTGEENAFIQHSNMYSPNARRALTTETRGQNSVVNFGPNGEMNQANPESTIYADQKVGLLPEWATDLPKQESNQDNFHKLLGFGNINQLLRKK